MDIEDLVVFKSSHRKIDVAPDLAKRFQKFSMFWKVEISARPTAQKWEETQEIIKSCSDSPAMNKN